MGSSHNVLMIISKFQVLWELIYVVGNVLSIYLIFCEAVMTDCVYDGCDFGSRSVELFIFF